MRIAVMITFVLVIAFGAVESHATTCDNYGSFKALAGTQHGTSWESATDSTPNNTSDYGTLCNQTYSFNLNLDTVDGVEAEAAWNYGGCDESYPYPLEDDGYWSYMYGGAWYYSVDVVDHADVCAGGYDYTWYQAVETGAFTNVNLTAANRMKMSWVYYNDYANGTVTFYFD